MSPLSEPNSHPVGHGPLISFDDRIHLDSKAFAADPFMAYRELRVRDGRVPQVYIAETPVTLITGFREALQVFSFPPCERHAFETASRCAKYLAERDY